MKLSKNLGTPDRLVRLIIGLILFVLAYLTLSWILLILALFTLLESLFSWCIIYQIFGRNTCKIQHKK